MKFTREELLATFGPGAQEFLRNAERQAEADRRFCEQLDKDTADEHAFRKFLEKCGVR